MVPNRRISKDKASAQAPLSAHPAFPPIVALWFGALFGLGSMVMPAVVLETAASLSGFASVWPQAEPPLGATARAMLALLATLLGLAAGWALARRLAAAQHVPRAPRRTRAVAPEAAPRRPISAHEELGGQSIDAAGQPQRPPITGRRRALTVAEEEMPSEYLRYAPLPEHVPLPGGVSNHPDDGAPPAPEPEFSPAEEPAMTDRPIDPTAQQPFTPAAAELDLTRFAPPSVAMPDPHLPPAEAQVFASAPVAEPAPIAAPAAYVPPLDTRKPRTFAAPSFETPAPEPAAPPVAPAPAGIDGALESLGLVQLIERLGRSLQRRPTAPPVEPDPEPIAFDAPSFEPAPTASVAVPPPVVPAGLQAFMAAPQPAEPFAEPSSAAPLASEPAAGEISEPAAADPFPSALRPFAFDQGDDGADDDPLDPGPLTLPLGSMTPRPFDAPAAPTSQFAEASGGEPEDEDDALSEADGGYSSLLAIKNPFRAPQPEFVRIDEPEPEDDAIEPAVVFPGQEARASEPAPQIAAETPPAPVRSFDAPHQPAPSTAPARAPAATDPAETDRALRSALANLQRMSGAA